MESVRTSPSSRLEPASFRDPDSRVFYAANGDVCRALSADGLADWQRLAATRFFPQLVAEGRLVGSELIEATAPDGFAAVLRHETIPFVSYPYEWCFGMLREAALLQLDLVAAALAEDMILKDASPYNVQWRGARPVFVDVGSFERLREGEPWAGYRQFCSLFLYPLMLQAWKGVPFNVWLRGSLEGISPNEVRGLLSLRDRLRRGVTTHVVLHSRLDRRYEAKDGVRRELKSAGFHKGLIEANVNGLRKLVRRLEWRPGPSTWSGYEATTTYTEEDAERKAAFVRAAAASSRWRLLWDLGCNDGRYTRLAAEHADYAVAVDGDAAVIERLYVELSGEGNETILPLTMNLADPSPGLGWRGRERSPLWERGRPELTLCLAFLHHLVISGNVPLRDAVDWLRSLGGALVVEFVTRDDPMAKLLLSRKREGLHIDYERAVFERLLADAFAVERTEELARGTRVLYFARPKA